MSDTIDINIPLSEYQSNEIFKDQPPAEQKKFYDDYFKESLAFHASQNDVDAYKKSLNDYKTVRQGLIRTQLNETGDPQGSLTRLNDIIKGTSIDEPNDNDTTLLNDLKEGYSLEGKIQGMTSRTIKVPNSDSKYNQFDLTTLPSLNGSNRYQIQFPDGKSEILDHDQVENPATFHDYLKSKNDKFSDSQSVAEYATKQTENIFTAIKGGAIDYAAQSMLKDEFSNQLQSNKELDQWNYVLKKLDANNVADKTLVKRSDYGIPMELPRFDPDVGENYYASIPAGDLRKEAIDQQKKLKADISRSSINQNAISIASQQNIRAIGFQDLIKLKQDGKDSASGYFTYMHDNPGHMAGIIGALTAESMPSTAKFISESKLPIAGIAVATLDAYQSQVDSTFQESIKEYAEKNNIDISKPEEFIKLLNDDKVIEKFQDKASKESWGTLAGAAALSLIGRGAAKVISNTIARTAAGAGIGMTAMGLSKYGVDLAMDNKPSFIDSFNAGLSVGSIEGVGAIHPIGEAFTPMGRAKSVWGRASEKKPLQAKVGEDIVGITGIAGTDPDGNVHLRTTDGSTVPFIDAIKQNAVTKPVDQPVNPTPQVQPSSESHLTESDLAELKAAVDSTKEPTPIKTPLTNGPLDATTLQRQPTPLDKEGTAKLDEYHNQTFDTQDAAEAAATEAQTYFKDNYNEDVHVDVQPIRKGVMNEGGFVAATINDEPTTSSNNGFQLKITRPLEETSPAISTKQTFQEAFQAQADKLREDMRLKIKADKPTISPEEIDQKLEENSKLHQDHLNELRNYLQSPQSLDDLKAYYKDQVERQNALIQGDAAEKGTVKGKGMTVQESNLRNQGGFIDLKAISDNIIEYGHKIFDLGKSFADWSKELLTKFKDFTIEQARNLWNAIGNVATKAYQASESLLRKSVNATDTANTQQGMIIGHSGAIRKNFSEGGDFIKGQIGPITSLQKAKEMSFNAKSDKDLLSSTQEKIRKETGWHIMPDGKFGFEVSDKNAELIGPKNYKDATNEQPYKLEPSFSLDQILKHDELKKMYPDIFKHTEVQFSPYINGAYYEPSLNLIKLGNGGDVLKTLLHEVQHVIQKDEGFLKGTSEKQALKDAISGVKARLDQITGNDVASRSARGQLETQLKILTRRGTNQSIVANSLYSRTFGEIQAREAEARSGMTDEERKAIPLYTEYPRNRWVINSGSGTSFSVQKDTSIDKAFGIDTRYLSQATEDRLTQLNENQALAKKGQALSEPKSVREQIIEDAKREESKNKILSLIHDTPKAFHEHSERDFDTVSKAQAIVDSHLNTQPPTEGISNSRVGLLDANQALNKAIDQHVASGALDSMSDKARSIVETGIKFVKLASQDDTISDTKLKQLNFALDAAISDGNYSLLGGFARESRFDTDLERYAAVENLPKKMYKPLRKIQDFSKTFPDNHALMSNRLRKLFHPETYEIWNDQTAAFRNGNGFAKRDADTDILKVTNAIKALYGKDYNQSDISKIAMAIQLSSYARDAEEPARDMQNFYKDVRDRSIPLMIGTGGYDIANRGRLYEKLLGELTNGVDYNTMSHDEIINQIKSNLDPNQHALFDHAVTEYGDKYMADLKLISQLKGATTIPFEENVNYLKRETRSMVDDKPNSDIQKAINANESVLKKRQRLGDKQYYEFDLINALRSQLNETHNELNTGLERDYLDYFYNQDSVQALLNEGKKFGYQPTSEILKVLQNIHDAKTRDPKTFDLISRGVNAVMGIGTQARYSSLKNTIVQPLPPILAHVFERLLTDPSNISHSMEWANAWLEDLMGNPRKKNLLLAWMNDHDFPELTPERVNGYDKSLREITEHVKSLAHDDTISYVTNDMSKRIGKQFRDSPRKVVEAMERIQRFTKEPVKWVNAIPERFSWRNFVPAVYLDEIIKKGIVRNADEFYDQLESGTHVTDGPARAKALEYVEQMFGSASLQEMRPEGFNRNAGGASVLNNALYWSRRTSVDLYWEFRRNMQQMGRSALNGDFKNAYKTMISGLGYLSQIAVYKTLSAYYAHLMLSAGYHLGVHYLAQNDDERKRAKANFEAAKTLQDRFRGTDAALELALNFLPGGELSLSSVGDIFSPLVVKGFTEARQNLNKDMLLESKIQKDKFTKELSILKRLNNGPISNPNLEKQINDLEERLNEVNFAILEQEQEAQPYHISQSPTIGSYNLLYQMAESASNIAHTHAKQEYIDRKRQEFQAEGLPEELINHLLGINASTIAEQMVHNDILDFFNAATGGAGTKQAIDGYFKVKESLTQQRVKDQLERDRKIKAIKNRLKSTEDRIND